MNSADIINAARDLVHMQNLEFEAEHRLAEATRRRQVAMMNLRRALAGIPAMTS